MKKLTENQIAELRTAYEEATDPKIKERYRGRLRRAEEQIKAVERESSAEFNAIETMEDFRTYNRKAISSSELGELYAKNQRVDDLTNWIELVLEGSDISRDPDWPSMQSGVAAVNEHVAQNGLCNVEFVILGQYWKLPLYDILKLRTDSTGEFARTGLLTALPELRVRQLQEKLAADRHVEVPKPIYISFLQCTLCGELLPQAATGLCGSCKLKQGKVRAFTKEQRSSDHTPFDLWGRVKSS
jgi:hypothetical protein